MHSPSTPISKNSVNAFAVSAVQHIDRSLDINVSADLKIYSVVIDITSTEHRNVIVRMMNAEKWILNMFSWYLMKGRNISSIKNYHLLETGMYALQIMHIGGEIIYAGKISLTPVRMYAKMKLHL